MLFWNGWRRTVLSRMARFTIMWFIIWNIVRFIKNLHSLFNAWNIQSLLITLRGTRNRTEVAVRYYSIVPNTKLTWNGFLPVGMMLRYGWRRYSALSYALTHHNDFHNVHHSLMYTFYAFTRGLVPHWMSEPPRKIRTTDAPWNRTTEHPWNVRSEELRLELWSGL